MKLALPRDADADLMHYRHQFEHEHLPAGTPQYLAQRYREQAQVLVDALAYLPGARVGLREALAHLRRSKDEAVSTAVHAVRPASGNPARSGDGAGTVET